MSVEHGSFGLQVASREHGECCLEIASFSVAIDADSFDADPSFSP